MRFSSCFGLDGGEELPGHHLYRSLKHSLAHARDRAADLNFSVVADYRNGVAFFQVEVAGAFQKAGLALAFYDHAKMTRRLYVFKTNVSGEHSLNCTDSRAKNGRVSIVAGFLKPLATGDAALQHSGISQSFEDAVADGMEFVGAFDFHGKVPGSKFPVQSSRCFVEPPTRNPEPGTRNLLRSRGRGLDRAARVNLGEMSSISV